MRLSIIMMVLLRLFWCVWNEQPVMVLLLLLVCCPYSSSYAAVLLLYCSVGGATLSTHKPL